jgi:hypothetical protein
VIKLTNEALVPASGSSDIVATNVTTVSTAAASNPDHFTNKAFVLALTLTDKDSKAQTTMDFHGVFNGTLDRSSSHLRATFSDRRQVVHLGQHLFTVTMEDFSPPHGLTPGSIGAHVDVRHNPEPSTLVLAGLGACLGGVIYYRRRGQRRRYPSPAVPFAGG